MKSTGALAIAAALFACGGPAAPRPRVTTPAPAPAARAPVVDAPYDLASDDDLADLHEQFALLSAGEARDAERERLAQAYQKRIRAALKTDQRGEAIEWLAEFLALWTPSELGRPQTVRELAEYLPILRGARNTFARSGSEREAALALMVLAMADPANRDGYLAELESIYEFAEELAFIAHRREAPGDPSIALLEYVVDRFPAPIAVDALVKQYLDRHAGGHDVINTTWLVSRALARGDRIAEAPAALTGIKPMGDDLLLHQNLREALAADAEPVAWLELAHYFDSRDGEQADMDAAYYSAVEGTRRFPDEADLFLRAGGLALARNTLSLSIQFTERAAKLAPKDREIANQLSRLYEQRMSGLVVSDRPNAAKTVLAEIEAFHARAAIAWAGEPLDRDLADAYASMGRGLVSLGEVSEARRYLRKSLDVRPSLDALETSGTIDLKQDKFSSSIDHFEQALALPYDDPSTRFARGRVQRLLGEAHLGVGNISDARRIWRQALEEWEEVGHLELTGRGRAELLVEVGKLYWALESREDAVELFERAIDQDTDSESIYADIVSFLAVRGEYAAAADAYHRALGSSDVGHYFKVYMSLWLLAESRRIGIEDDPIAVNYLASRSGSLWHDRLARLAIGDVKAGSLTAEATSRGRRAELAFYQAVLELAPEDPNAAIDRLRDVLNTNMVLFFEYDMAKHILANGLLEQQARANSP